MKKLTYKNLLDMENWGKKEKNILNALCIDYTCVYYCNLDCDLISEIKQEENTRSMLMGEYKASNMASFSYRMRYFYDNFVLKESAPDFLQKMSVEHLKQYLSHNQRFAYRLRTVPNPLKHEFFEIQMVPLKQEDGFCVVMGFRYIDDIVDEQERKRILDELLLDHEIISAVSKLYFSVYRIDLVRDFYEEISSDKSIHRLTGHEGSAQQKMYEICNSIVAEDYRDAVYHFFDLSTVPERLSQTDTVEIEYLAVDGNWHQARFIEKKRNESGLVTHILYVTRIVSQEKQQELEQQRLQIAYQVAENANEAKTTFLLNMSHDIRTPMNAILGFSKLMRDKLTDPELLHYQEMIDESGQILLSIINNVLDMARIESGKMELDENYNETGNVVTNVCKVFEVEAEKKNIQFIHNVDVEHSHILCDITKMQEIFTNLISNAVKYTPAGGKITVTTTEVPCDKEGYVIIKSVVEDNGIGMSREYLPKLFEAFSRERNTTAGKVLGTGLGMSIVKSLVELMGGTIEVESEPGKGTRFTVAIPHKLADRKYYEKAPLQGNAPEADSFRGKHILLAEDNELNAEIATAILEGMGFTIDHAEDGIMCVDKLEHAKPGTYDFILMDIQMPNMDGYKATRVIRRLPDKEKANIPIVAMTANAFEEDRKKAFEMGMNGHIAKPIDVEKIKSTLADILK